MILHNLPLKEPWQFKYKVFSIGMISKLKTKLWNKRKEIVLCQDEQTEKEVFIKGLMDVGVLGANKTLFK